MAIGERIHYFRLLRGFTQKYLGKLLGFSDSQADVRIAQYEKGARSPKEKYLNALAQIFEVSPHALNVPDIDTDIGLMHTLFTLEDTRGLKIGKLDGELCLRLDKDTGMTYHSMWDMFNAWYQQAEKLESGEITKEEYDQWRYTYPKMEAEQTRQELDALREKRKAENNTDWPGRFPDGIWRGIWFDYGGNRLFTASHGADLLCCAKISD